MTAIGNGGCCKGTCGNGTGYLMVEDADVEGWRFAVGASIGSATTG